MQESMIANMYQISGMEEWMNQYINMQINNCNQCNYIKYNVRKRKYR